MTADEARAAALDLPEAVEQDHHGFPSFRVRGKIFATMPDASHLHVMLGEDGIRMAVAENAAWCVEQWWGKRLAAARVTLPEADGEIVTELLTDAWRLKAPASLRKAHPDR